MSDDKLKEIAERATDNIECATQIKLSETDRETAALNILAALQQARDLGREEEHAEWLAKSASVADTAKAAFERVREEERKALRKWASERYAAAAGDARMILVKTIVDWLDARSSQDHKRRDGEPR